MKRKSRIASSVVVCTLFMSIQMTCGQNLVAQTKADSDSTANSSSASAKPANDSLFQRIKAVSARSKAVSSAKGYSEVIAECDALLSEELNKQSYRDYLTKLLAWALDKRGEARMELAQQFGQPRGK